MKFAEMTQEVHITRPTTVKLDLGFTPGRRQANKVTILTHIIFSRICTFTHININFILFRYSRKQEAN